jgi:hypothetical protein
MAPTPETIRVYTVDQDDNPVAGVLVRIFDETGTTFITQNYTAIVGSVAYAEFTLDGDDPAIDYTIRLSKTGVAFDGLLGDDSKSTQLISVYSPPASAPNGNNWFQVQGQTFVTPTSTDPRLCRASGFFRDAAGRPYPNLDIFIIAQFKPAIVDGNAVMGERVELRTDENGFAQVDLFRNGEYRITIQSLEDYTRQVFVPDRTSVNLVDLIFPVVKSITWDPVSAVMSVGDALDVYPSVFGSDFHELTGAALEDVQYEILDPSVASLQSMPDRLILIALSTGTTQVQVTRLDQTIVVIPDTGITNNLLDVSVS